MLVAHRLLSSPEGSAKRTLRGNKRQPSNNRLPGYAKTFKNQGFLSHHRPTFSFFYTHIDVILSSLSLPIDATQQGEQAWFPAEDTTCAFPHLDNISECFLVSGPAQECRACVTRHCYAAIEPWFSTFHKQHLEEKDFEHTGSPRSWS